MSRLYRVRYRNSHGEEFTIANAVPSDVADGYMLHLEDSRIYEWIRIWIETLDGELVHEIKRSPWLSA